MTPNEAREVIIGLGVTALVMAGALALTWLAFWLESKSRR